MKTNELLSIEAQEYHAAPGCSASMLEKLRMSPAHLKAYIDGELEDESPALSLGTLCHRALFEPDTLTADSVCFQPETIWIQKERQSKLKSAIPVLTDTGSEKIDGDKIEVHWSGKLTECKDWIKENAKGKAIVGAQEWKTATRIRDNAHREGTVRRLLSGGYAEQALFVEDGSGTLRKSKYDYITTAGNCIPDLKTARCGKLEKFEKVIQERGYHIRAAFYIDNANLAGMSKDTFAFIVVETAPPFLVTVYQLRDDVLEFGRQLYKAELQTYRNCLESGRWPGYHEGIKEITLPSYVMMQLEREGINDL